MTCRATRRERVLVSRGVHPHYRGDAADVLRAAGLELDEIPLVADGAAAGTTDLAALERMLAEPGPAGRRRHRRPAGLPRPARADARDRRAGPRRRRAVRRGHRAGQPGRPRPARRVRRRHRGRRGPAARASRRSTAARTSGSSPRPTRSSARSPAGSSGMTTDLDGQRAFVMTMRAREQDIRRDKAASNICTNQALLALAASIYLADDRSARAARRRGARAPRGPPSSRRRSAAVGAPRLHPGPYLNEFAVRVPDARTVHRRLLDRGVLAGLVLADAEPDDPSLADGLLVCATEVTTSRRDRALRGGPRRRPGRPPIGVEAGAGTVARRPASR